MIAAHLGVRRYVAPMVLEGGSFFVDGEGTLITTEQCLLNENRNPNMSREQIESTLPDYLGIDKVVWLGEGHYEDFSTDGHIDDIAHFVSPGRVILHTPSNPAHPDHRKGIDNARRLREATDARGRTIDVVEFDTGEPAASLTSTCTSATAGSSPRSPARPRTRPRWRRSVRCTLSARSSPFPPMCCSWPEAAAPTASPSRSAGAFAGNKRSPSHPSSRRAGATAPRAAAGRCRRPRRPAHGRARPDRSVRAGGR